MLNISTKELKPNLLKYIYNLFTSINKIKGGERGNIYNYDFFSMVCIIVNPQKL